MEENMEKEDQHLKEMGSLPLKKNGNSKIELITIIGEVEGHETVSGNTKATKYEHLLPKLAQIENDDEVDGVLILLNTLGGDVEAGLAIAEMIAGLSKPTVSLVPLVGHWRSRQIILLLWKAERWLFIRCEVPECLLGWPRVFGIWKKLRTGLPDFLRHIRK